MLDILGLEFFRNALLAGLLLGAFCSLLGMLVVLKRIVFVGAALAEVSSAGIALGFLLGFSEHGLAPLLFSLALTLVAVGFFAGRGRSRLLPDDALIALVFVAASAGGIVLVSQSAQGFEEVHHLVSGNILTVTRGDLLAIAVACAVLGATVLVFFRVLVFTAFDPEMADSLGIRSRRWNFLFYLIVGVTLTLGIRTVGTLLAFGYLVLPAMIGLVTVRRIGRASAVAVASGLIATLSGLFLSVRYDLPSSPTVVVVLTLLLGGAAAVFRLRRAG